MYIAIKSITTGGHSRFTETQVFRFDTYEGLELWVRKNGTDRVKFYEAEPMELKLVLQREVKEPWEPKVETKEGCNNVECPKCGD